MAKRSKAKTAAKSSGKRQQQAPENAPITVSGRWLAGAVLATVVVAALFAYATLCILFYQGQWQLVLHPAKAITATPASRGLNFDDIHFEHRAYEPFLAYGQSKTANVLFAVEATKRWASDGITVNALMPGGIRTNLQRYVSDEELERLRVAAGATGTMWKTPEQGAATSILVATSPLLDGVGGRYFDDCNEAEVGKLSARNGVAEYALDPDAAARLWQVSVETLAGGPDN